MVDRNRIDRRRVAILAALTGGLLVVYLALGAARILRMSMSGEGGYRFGGGLQVLKNLLAYFGFPFAPGIVEIQAFPFWDARLVPRLILQHLVLVGLILRRAGPRWALIYLIAFYATLLPVLPISKYETQYTYASSIALAIALALPAVVRRGPGCSSHADAGRSWPDDSAANVSPRLFARPARWRR